MKIAVCDGDVKACREIRRMLDRYGEKERVFLETELFSESGALCQEAEAGKSGLLQAIFFGLDYQVSLIYQLMNEEQYFQVWLAKEE